MARLGGDEFAIFAVDLEAQHALLLDQRVREQLLRFKAEHPRPYELSFSIGLSQQDLDLPYALDDLLRRADENMYEEKRRKREARSAGSPKPTR